MMLKDAKQYDVLDLDVLWKELGKLEYLETLNNKGDKDDWTKVFRWFTC